MLDLFADAEPAGAASAWRGDPAPVCTLPGLGAAGRDPDVAAVSPFRHMVTRRLHHVGGDDQLRYGRMGNQRTGYLYAPDDPSPASPAAHACGFSGALP